MTAIQSVLLGLAVLVQAVAAVGMLAAREPLDRLHLVGPVSVLATILVVAAVGLDGGSSTLVAKAVVTGGFLWVASPFVTRATARALRVRAAGRLELAGEEVDREDPT